MATYYKWCKKCRTKHDEKETSCPKCGRSVQLRSDDFLGGIFGTIHDDKVKK